MQGYIYNYIARFFETLNCSGCGQKEAGWITIRTLGLLPLCGAVAATIFEFSADRFFASEVKGHQDLHRNPPPAAAKLVDTHDLSQRLAIDRAERLRVWIRDKQAHPLFVELVFGYEVHAFPRRVQGRQDFVEVAMKISV